MSLATTSTETTLSVVIDGTIDTAETYTEYGTDGVTVTLTRTYTTVELLEKAERSALRTVSLNSEALRAQAQAAIDKLMANRKALATLAAATNATINANPAPYIKGVGAALDEATQRLVQVIRIVSGLLAVTDS